MSNNNEDYFQWFKKYILHNLYFIIFVFNFLDMLLKTNYDLSYTYRCRQTKNLIMKNNLMKNSLLTIFFSFHLYVIHGLLCYSFTWLLSILDIFGVFQKKIPHLDVDKQIIKRLKIVILMMNAWLTTLITSTIPSYMDHYLFTWLFP